LIGNCFFAAPRTERSAGDNKIGEVNKRIDGACKAANDLSKRIDTTNSTLVTAINDSTQASRDNNATPAKRLAALEAKVAELEK
jgi:hypothetical protein